VRSDAQANRERVLAAAEEVFAEAGDAGSTEEVARRAGVGIGTVFRHFPTKQLLVEAAVVRHFARLSEQAGELTGARDPGAAFRDFVRTMVLGTPAKLALVTVLGGLTGPARAASLELRTAVAALLVRAQEAGAIRPDASVDEVYVLIRALAQASGDPAVVTRAVDIVLDGLSSARP